MSVELGDVPMTRRGEASVMPTPEGLTASWADGGDLYRRGQISGWCWKKWAMCTCLITEPTCASACSLLTWFLEIGIRPLVLPAPNLPDCLDQFQRRVPHLRLHVLVAIQIVMARRVSLVIPDEPINARDWPRRDHLHVRHPVDQDAPQILGARGVRLHHDRKRAPLEMLGIIPPRQLHGPRHRGILPMRP